MRRSFIACLWNWRLRLALRLTQLIEVRPGKTALESDKRIAGFRAALVPSRPPWFLQSRGSAPSPAGFSVLAHWPCRPALAGNAPLLIADRFERLFGRTRWRSLNPCAPSIEHPVASIRLPASGRGARIFAARTRLLPQLPRLRAPCDASRGQARNNN